MATVRSGPLIGFAGQLAVLGALAGTVGLGPAGWLAGTGYALVLLAALRRATLGPADRVTLARATLVGGVTALAADSLTRPEPLTVLVTLAAVALAMDAVDGPVARRTGTVSALGARLDMEIDSFLLLVLGAYVSGSVGGWVLAIGLMRYAFGAAGWVVPWMRAELPPRYWRKVVAATQGVVLVVAASGLLPRPFVVVLVALALALLVESFGRDVGWLWRHRAGRGAVHGSVRGGPVRSRGHADPADRQRDGAVARGGGPAWRPRRPRGGQPGLAAGARPQ